MSFCIELFCVVTLQYQILVRIAIAYFIIEKKKSAPQPWQAIAQRFCSIGICKGGFAMKKIGLGIAILLFAIIISLCSSGMGLLVIGIGIVGLIFSIIGFIERK